MRLLFCLLLVVGCGDDNPDNNNMCGHTGTVACCPGTGRPQGVACTPGNVCADFNGIFSCSCDAPVNTWSCHDTSVRDLAVTSTD